MSGVSLEELRLIEATVGWTDTDAAVLRRHESIFERHAEAMVDSWRGVIASQPHLAQWFFGPDGRPDEVYKAKVRVRFVQWVRDVATRPHDAEWLAYQDEIGLRHTPAKKNVTDGANTPPLVPLRYLLAFTSVTVIATREFFAGEVEDPAERRRLEDAWTKAVLLHITLWSRAYAANLW